MFSRSRDKLRLEKVIEVETDTELETGLKIKELKIFKYGRILEALHKIHVKKCKENRRRQPLFSIADVQTET